MSSHHAPAPSRRASLAHALHATHARWRSTVAANVTFWCYAFAKRSTKHIVPVFGLFVGHMYAGSTSAFAKLAAQAQAPASHDAALQTLINYLGIVTARCTCANQPLCRWRASHAGALVRRCSRSHGSRPPRRWPWPTSR